MNRFPFRSRPLQLLTLLLVVGCFFAYRHINRNIAHVEKAGAQPVRVAVARTGDVPMYFHALGTVTPPNTITVRSRVEGQLMALFFTEGQTIQAGELLAQIDSRPFEVQKKQAKGALARDEALLKNANLDLARYRRLIKEQSVSLQQVQGQEALVGQYEGAVAVDKAAVADAELNLAYSRITAPVSGRIGLKKVDIGNMIRTSDANGIVVITQMQPMHVVFSLVEKQLPEVLEAIHANNAVTVDVWVQESTRPLASGTLLSIDNQIDVTTGTVKAKAAFDNEEERLFPNQFVNVRLRIKDFNDALIIPTAAAQRNNEGFFVYVVEGGKVAMRPITVAYSSDTVTVVATGLKPGNVVITDGVDRLRDGTPVFYEGQPPLQKGTPDTTETP